MCSAGINGRLKINRARPNCSERRVINSINKKYIADFVFVKNAKKVIIANSTFSWWAAFLGEGKVYYPYIKFPWLPNPTKSDIDLGVYNESRYNFVYWE